MHSLRREGKKLKALAVCNHPGGARVVLPVTKTFIEKTPEIFFDLVLTHNSFPFFNLAARSARKTIVDEEVSPEDYDKLDLRQYAFVLAGTSISGNLERSFVRKAREQGVPSFSVLDHWCEYRVRFQDSSGYLNAVPDTIFVPDEIAQRDLLDMGIPGRQIVVSGHPALDVAGKAAQYFSEKKRSQILQQLALKDDRDYVLFVSEPVESDHGSKDLGYSEFSILERICSTLLQLGKEIRPPLVIKLHPREDSSKYAPMLRAYRALKIVSVKDEIDRFDLMLSAKLVLGISSLLLLEAAVLGLPVYSVIPGDDEQSFIGVRLGWVKHLRNQADIEDSLKMKKNDSPHLPTKRRMLSAYNISDFILSTINLK
ncbi:MAG: UDP-N-acetylglucosamine 2-epimerase [Deltaproteobacteria bacterium]|nr:UDP-N-acetylglucosamine 2-epimerase [Deltaproteobacteria bacterium]